MLPCASAAMWWVYRTVHRLPATVRVRLPKSCPDDSAMHILGAIRGTASIKSLTTRVPRMFGVRLQFPHVPTTALCMVLAQVEGLDCWVVASVNVTPPWSVVKQRRLLFCFLSPRNETWLTKLLNTHREP